MTSLTIAQLTPDRSDEAADLLAAAFAADPFHRAAYGDDARSRSARFYRARLADGEGTWIGACRGGVLLGVIHWRRDSQCSAAPLLADAAAMTQLGWLDRVARRVFEWTVSARSPEDASASMRGESTVTLGPLAVLPARQGQGIGSQLMRQFCDELDAHGQPGYLETAQPGLATFYERFGFSIVNEIAVLGIVGVAMSRPAIRHGE